jgi:hypothetical protein
MELIYKERCAVTGARMAMSISNIFVPFRLFCRHKR